MKLGKFLNTSQRKFVLSIGDEGAILVSVEGSKMLSRVFLSSPKSKELATHLAAAPDAPIYVLIDVVDQAYVQHNLPPVSRLNINKLVGKKLSRDFDEEDIKSAIPMGKEKTGRKDWLYMLVSIRNVPPFSEWMDAVSETINPFGGIFLLPLETTKYLRDIRKSLKTENTEWQIVVTHNRVGGFRQIVFKDGYVVFTRIVQPIGGKTPDVAAGNIEQETLNTIEYIRRLGYNEEKNLDIYIIASKEVKNVLDSSNFPASKTYILTPHEVATHLKLENAAEEKDQYGDVVFAAHFAAQKKHLMRLNTPYTKTITQFQQGITFARVFTILAAIITILFSVKSFVDAGDLKESIKKAEKGRYAAQDELDEINKFMLQFDENPERVKDISTMDKKLTKDMFFPAQFVSEYASIKGFNMHVDSFDMTLTEREGEKDYINASFNVTMFASDSSKLEQLLEDIDLFSGDIKRKFSDYTVTISGLPDKNDIKLDLLSQSKDNKQNISIEITGPNDSKAETKGNRRARKR